MKRVALVTGADRGVGFEICRQLGAAGYTVVLTARNPERGAAAVCDLVREGLDVRFQELDVAQPAAVRKVAAWVESEHGRLDALINNAAIAIDATDSLTTLDLEVMRRTLETNFLGALACCQACLPMMRAASYGRIVNVSSGRSLFSKLAAGGPGYRISKAALNALTVILADEVKESNILVNAMTPGWVRTRMGGLLTAPRSVSLGAETAVWLATLPDSGPRGRFFKDRKELPW